MRGATFPCPELKSDITITTSDLQPELHAAVMLPSCVYTVQSINSVQQSESQQSLSIAVEKSELSLLLRAIIFPTATLLLESLAAFGVSIQQWKPNMIVVWGHEARGLQGK